MRIMENKKRGPPPQSPHPQLQKCRTKEKKRSQGEVRSDQVYFLDAVSISRTAISPLILWQFPR